MRRSEKLRERCERVAPEVLMEKNPANDGKGRTVKEIFEAEAKALGGVPEDIIPDSCITIFYHISFFLESDFDEKKPFDTTFTSSPSKYRVGQQELPGLVSCLLQLSLGDSCYAIISPEKAFGKIGVPPKVPPNSELFLQLEIVDIESNFIPRFLAHPPGLTKCIGPEYVFQEVVEFAERAKASKNLANLQKSVTVLSELESSPDRDRQLLINIQRVIIFGKKKLPNQQLIKHAKNALALDLPLDDHFLVNISLKIRYHLMDLYTWKHFDDFKKAREVYKEFEQRCEDQDFNCLVKLTAKEDLEKMKGLVEKRYKKMHEREILTGIEEILAEKGKFSPDLDHETIRNNNRKLQRVKENVFRKQVKEVWSKHGPRLMAQIRAAQASADVGANMNGILQNQYRGTPKAVNKMTNGTPVSLDRKRKEKSDDDDFEDQAPISKLRRLRKDKIDRFSAEVPEETFSSVGGLSEPKETILRQMMHLHEPRIYATLGVRPPSGILVHGAPGAGKTLLCKSSAGEIQVKMISVTQIRQLFENAKENAPCIIFLDELDAICSSRDENTKEMSNRIIAQLLTCMDDVDSNEILVLGATSKVENIDSSLRRAGRFDQEIAIGIPSEKERLAVMQVVCKDLKLSANCELRLLARLTPGYVAADLDALAREAAQEAIDRICQAENETGEEKKFNRESAWERWKEIDLSDDVLGRGFNRPFGDFQKALKKVVPSAKREGFATVPDTTWDDVGALEKIREELSMSILAPIRNPRQFERLGLSRPSGVLLTGPPGCGKTLLAKAIANESGLNFISVKGPELLNMYVGESERAVRSVFTRARSSKPCVIFFDEIDALTPRRAEGANSGATRIVNQLLTELDGLEDRKDVYIIAATNRYEIIDPAVLRPGRLDKTVYVGLPSKEDIKQIILKVTRNGVKPPFGSDVDLDAIIDKTVNYSGADATALVREAALIRV
ncbi:Oidioi.mRNA.OKI2018_I69.chr2.g4075.t1.cds [Oikopleura dioica]|uniref:peptidylprolyl isomerase n=1 Tax=Oikopleura dioica TaxID=34765 RepID=A0ABN7T1N2_OIKDI|nr:Oidioi.mRNA.OKI2018_I69.chr2.g4075.t1.cds [Oikopleura dioica]